jgi:multimeric flavodoxin WrbA
MPVSPIEKEPTEQKPLVVIVQGSPRSYGNCARLAVEAFDILDKAGFEALIVSASTLMEEATPCNGCMTCLATGDCVHDDGVELFIDMLDEACGLMWITPVYFSTLPGQLKELIDRLQVFWARRQRGEALTFEQRRPAASLIVGSGFDPFGTEAVSIPLTSVSNIAEFTLGRPTVLTGLDEVDALMEEANAEKLSCAKDAITAFADEVGSWHANFSAQLPQIIFESSDEAGVAEQEGA